MPLAHSSSRQRCAIYTRKSTDARLEHDFNTLESQREVCSAYITSQRHKGWLELIKHYDDAAQSGGSIDRPALQDLMRDIEHNRIDVIVIYKIDRLTRSLADFVRLMDLFERYDISFVSVTQAFDTSDSMGRLVLNILLTFAQFEREMIADRIRDKYAAMRKRGKYVGGVPPYGYDVVERKLVPNPIEAAKVRSIFARFLALGSYSALCDELQAEGLRTKVWTTSKGTTRGGQLVSNGMIYALLGNCIYAGQVAYQGKCYDGEHDAILSPEVWESAQALRERRSMYRPNVGPSPNILLGLLYDCHGRRMVICDERKRDRPYRYYASEQAHWGVREGIKRYRTRALELEELVLATLSETLCDREKTRSALLALGRHGPEVEQLSNRGAIARRQLEAASLKRRRDILMALVVRGILDGTQPAGLTRKKLVHANLPLDWALQRRLFGFAPRPDHQRSEPRF